MRAIIIAAGQGQRLRPYTDDRPKCMVPVAGRPILHHQIEALGSHGIDDIVVIRGYLADRIEAPGVTFVENEEFETNNILMSLFCAGAHLVGDVVVSYADIVYHPNVVGALLRAQGTGAVVVDRGWHEAYQGRTDHPVSEAELCRITPSGAVLQVGKHVGPDAAFGEFIGLARFSAAVVARFWSYYIQGLAYGDNHPFGFAETLRQAYLTDLLNVAIDNGERLNVAPIMGQWREIDTVQDLVRAEAVVAGW